MQDFEKTKKTRVKQAPQRGHYDRETAYAILDEGMVCHIGIVVDGKPVVIPTVYWRDGDDLYFHGASKSRLILASREAEEICITVTLLDALVIARSGFHHSMNYRSVVMFGRAEQVTDDDEQFAALKIFMEGVAPGRWDELRAPNKQEMKATIIMRLPINEATSKIRSGPPIDDDEDMAADVWAGEIPIALTYGEPVPDPQLRAGIAVPGNLPSGKRS